MARLAGVPSEAIRRARGYLARLDRFNAAGAAQADLFASGMAAGDDDEARDAAIASRDAVGSALEAIDPDALTPREALAALYELKRLLR